MFSHSWTRGLGPMDQEETEDGSHTTETRVDSGNDHGPETVDTPCNPVHGDDDTAASSSSDCTQLSLLEDVHLQFFEA